MAAPETKTYRRGDEELLQQRLGAHLTRVQPGWTARDLLEVAHSVCVGPKGVGCTLNKDVSAERGPVNLRVAYNTWLARKARADAAHVGSAGSRKRASNVMAEAAAAAAGLELQQQEQQCSLRSERAVKAKGEAKTRDDLVEFDAPPPDDAPAAAASRKKARGTTGGAAPKTPDIDAEVRLLQLQQQVQQQEAAIEALMQSIEARQGQYMAARAYLLAVCSRGFFGSEARSG